MTYVRSLTIPPGQSLMEPIPVSPGVIRRGEISFPAGCHGLVQARLLWRGATIAPTQTHDVPWFVADDTTVSWGEGVGFQISEPPYEVVVHAVNNDRVFPHTITVRLHMAPISSDALDRLQETAMIVAALSQIVEELRQLRSRVDEICVLVQGLSFARTEVVASRRTLRETDRFLDP